MSSFYYPLLVVVVIFGVSSFLMRLWHRSRTAGNRRSGKLEE